MLVLCSMRAQGGEASLAAHHQGGYRMDIA